ncbi:MAG: hypothetical protein IIC21_11345, partial [Chloroflexi bacterium]|nr:hypothetical protein [Chloroflexota bacterium]
MLEAINVRSVFGERFANRFAPAAPDYDIENARADTDLDSTPKLFQSVVLPFLGAVSISLLFVSGLIYFWEALTAIGIIRQGHAYRRVLEDDALDGAVGRTADEIAALVSLSEFANVSVKATSVSGYSNEEYPYPALQPVLQQVFDAFGPERLFWGSDLTRLRGSYAELVSLFVEELGFLSGADLDAVMGG